MKRTSDAYTIPLQGLKDGKFDETLKIGKEFIDEQKIEGVFDANLSVTVHFVKQVDLHTLSIQLKGMVAVECDRCLEIFDLPIEMNQDMIVKIGEPTDELADEENVIIVSPEETEFGISSVIYEMIMLSLPLKKVHKSEKDCNSDMMTYLKQSKKVKKEVKTDPRWDSLKNINLK